MVHFKGVLQMRHALYSTFRFQPCKRISEQLPLQELLKFIGQLQKTPWPPRFEGAVIAIRR